jgi:hypothetical protein
MKEERAIKKAIIFKYKRRANDYIFVMFIFVLKVNYFFEK